MTEDTPDFEEVAALAMKLKPKDKIKLIERLAMRLKYDVTDAPPAPRESMLGALADLGEAPSYEDFREARTKAWYSGEESPDAKSNC